MVATPDRQERQVGRAVMRLQVRLDRCRQDRCFGHSAASGEAVEPLEEIGVNQDRGSLLHMWSYIPYNGHLNTRLTFVGNQHTNSCREVEPVNRFEPNLRIPGPTSLPDSLRDKVLSVTIGAFGDRFAKIATTYGANVTKLASEWGKAAEAARVREALETGGPWKAVLLTQNETSTAVTNPIAELAATVKAAAPDALIIVDAISGLGAVPFETDAWGLDVVVSGSQKAWMVAPGLSFVAVSPRAWEAAAVAKMPKFYFDLAAHKTSAESGQTPWTPAVAVMFQLDVALDLIE